MAAVGCSELIDGSVLTEGVAVSDAGVDAVDADTEEGYELVGDVDFESARERAAVITPVPAASAR